ncbi:hypothetical protein [uncultured Tenacibaculum sp.]|uniref:hypothetical protein n=1 Tax=uncultured Tenacibaculum sp. TaxID=174713 RepID=UPI0026104625|nr:hypothetical protein [uncultured Tenacibaculum sp.]
MSIKNLNIYQILDHLERRKALFLGNHYSFNSLDAFINGYSCTANDSHWYSEEFNDFSFFNVWLLGHLPKHFGETGGWYWQIHNRNLNDDENAFKEFFFFLNLFKTSKKFTNKITDISYSIENKTTATSHKIDTIEKVTFENSTSIWIFSYSNNELVDENWFVTESNFLKWVQRVNNTFITIESIEAKF